MDYDALIEQAKRWADMLNGSAVEMDNEDGVMVDYLLAVIADLRARNEALVKANGILEDALQEVGDDYPGSSCQEWCQQRVKAARAFLAANREG